MLPKELLEETTSGVTRAYGALFISYCVKEVLIKMDSIAGKLNLENYMFTGGQGDNV